MGVPNNHSLPTYTGGRQSLISSAQQAQSQAARNYGANHQDMYVMGKPMWMWLLWAGYIGYVPTRSVDSVVKIVAELDALTAEKSDEWAAFVAAQRVQGNKIWDTEAT